MHTRTQRVCRQRTNSIARDYILPDYHTRMHGLMCVPSGATSDEPTLRLSHERFSIGETLFSPSMIGVTQMGVVEATAYAISKCPEGQRPSPTHTGALCQMCATGCTAILC
jgi:hypothetical protein